MKQNTSWAALALFAAIVAQPARAEIYAGKFSQSTDSNIISVFSPSANGDVAPSGLIGGATTGLRSANGIYFDPQSRLIYASDFVGTAIRVFGVDQRGNVAPLRVITSPSLGQPRKSAANPTLNELYVVTSLCCVSTYPANANGEVAALRTFGGGDLTNPGSLAYRASTEEIYVVDYAQTGPTTFVGEILVYPRTTNMGSPTPTRAIRGDLTQLGTNAVSGIALNENQGEMYVLSYFNSDDYALVTFDINANGNVAPKRVVRGAATLLRNTSGLFYEEAGDRILVTSGAFNDTPRLLSFPRLAEGNVAPTLNISGANTGVTGSTGWTDVFSDAPAPTLFKDGFE